MNLHRSAMLRCESLRLLPAGLLSHIIVHQINQLSPHVLIQSMRTSFCVCRLISRQNIGDKYQIRAIDAGNRSTGVMLSNGSSRSPPLFSLLIPIFRGRNQRFIMECTLLWTIAGHRPQCKVPAKVSQNSVKCTPESGHGKSPNPYSWTKKRPPPEWVDSEKKCPLCALPSHIIHIIHQISVDFKDVIYA